jgi:hypothetical protein
MIAAVMQISLAINTMLFQPQTKTPLTLKEKWLSSTVATKKPQHRCLYWNTLVNCSTTWRSRHRFASKVSFTSVSNFLQGRINSSQKINKGRK